MLTLSEIRSRVRTRYEASSTTRWSDADINAAINDGLGELSEATRYFEQWVSIPLKDSRTYYDLRDWIPFSFLSVSAVWHQSGNRWLSPTSHTDMKTQRWEITDGNPVLWFTRGLWWLGIFPHPSSDLAEFVRVYYSAVAPGLEEDGEEPAQLPDEFVPALEEYALYELTQKDGETDKALYWYAKYKARETALEQHMAHRISTARTGAIGRA
jgi:hypothetical protein